MGPRPGHVPGDACQPRLSPIGEIALVGFVTEAMHDEISHLGMEDILEGERHLIEVMRVVGSGTVHKPLAIAKWVVNWGRLSCTGTRHLRFELGHRDTSLVVWDVVWEQRWDGIVAHHLFGVPVIPTLGVLLGTDR